LPSPERTAELWRTEAAHHGIALHLCSVESAHVPLQPLPAGFDASIEFVPRRHHLQDRIGFSRFGPRRLEARVRRALGLPTPFTQNTVVRYDSLVRRVLSTPGPDHLRYPCVTPRWDNTARRSAGGAWILVDATPEAYGDWLFETLRRFDPPAPDRNLVFVNAWNEWAEGAYLEPDERHGRRFLDAHRQAVERAQEISPNGPSASDP
jgi:hypothetical protein